MIQLIITKQCNLRCGHCMYSCGRLTDEHMDTWTFTEAIPWIREAPGVYVMGGEPTLHPHFPELFALIARHARKIRLVTNGTRLDPESHEHNVHAIVEAADHVGRANFSVTISNDRWHRQHVQSEVIRAAQRTLLDIGISVRCDRVDDDFTLYPLGRARYGAAWDHIEARGMHLQPAECTKGQYNPWENLSIGPRGDISPCPHHTWAIGNVATIGPATAVRKCEEYVRRMKDAEALNRDCSNCNKLYFQEVHEYVETDQD